MASYARRCCWRQEVVVCWCCLDFSGAKSANDTINDEYGKRRLRMKNKTVIQRERHRKDPRHLLMLPFFFGIAGAACYGLVSLACLMNDGGFSAYSESAKYLIVIPCMFASIPIGLLNTNLLVWSIPPIRRFFDREAQGRPGGNFGDSMRELIVFAKYWSGIFIVLGFATTYLTR